MINESISQLGLAFFGLTSKTSSEFRAGVFKQIHEICFNGNGGYDWNTVYNMPIWLRKFTFKQIQSYYTQQNEQSESKTQDGTTNLVNSDGTINTPEFAKTSQPYKGKTSYK